MIILLYISQSIALVYNQEVESDRQDYSFSVTDRYSFYIGWFTLWL
jgi:hypothetical protein